VIWGQQFSRLELFAVSPSVVAAPFEVVVPVEVAAPSEWEEHEEKTQ